MVTYRPISQPLNRPVRLAVLISGGGTTLLNFLDKIKAGELSAEVTVVIASRPDCSGIAKCQRAGLRCEVIARKTFADTASFSKAIFEQCRAAQADLVTLAGFLSLIEIPEDFTGRVMNIHPALIPAFCGKGMHGHHVHEAVLARGVKVSGCTVHFADNHYDQGPIILQRAVPVEEGDTADTLAARVFAAECQAYPEAIALFGAGRLEVIDGRVQVLRPDDWYCLPREVPSAITRQLLNQTPDKKLHELLFNYVFELVTCGGSIDEQLQRIPEGLRIVWRLAMLDTEVGNGGFEQYFGNIDLAQSGLEVVYETLTALEKIRDEQKFELLTDAMQLRSEEVQLVMKTNAGSKLTDQELANLQSRYDRLSKRYYDLDDDVQSSKLARFARANPESFLHSPSS